MNVRFEARQDDADWKSMLIIGRQGLAAVTMGGSGL
jgi:hypothetical protein